MPTRAAIFFYSTVKPTVDEFLGESLDIRRGRLAAIVLNHMADYWWLENKLTYTTIGQLRAALLEECPEYSIVRDVADATKHAQLDRTPRNLSSSEQVKRQFGAAYNEAPYNTVAYNQAPMVLVTLDDGTTRPLIGAVRSVLSVWEKKVSQANSVSTLGTAL